MKRSVLSSLACAVALWTWVTSAAADAPVRRGTQALALEDARQLDALAQKLRGRDLCYPRYSIDDATFARRTYLAVAGRIPTPPELEAFLGSGGSEKHVDLVDHLLDSPAYHSHAFNGLADLLRVQSRHMGADGAPYIHWIKEQVARDTPFDAFVRQLLTATGPAYARGHGATGFALRDAYMLEDNMAATVRAFLGEGIECAQCHDHPFEPWTRRQYYELVAFNGGLKYYDAGGDEAVARLKSLASERWGQAGRRGAQGVAGVLRAGVTGTGTGAIPLPEDYQYRDGEALEWVSARTPFGPEVVISPPALEYAQSRVGGSDRGRKVLRNREGLLSVPEIDSREAFAEWLTSPSNPRFAETLGERLWEATFGYPLKPPAGASRRSREAFEMLRRHLGKLVKARGYHLRELRRTLLYMQLWRAPAHGAAGGELDPSPILRRMSAEQAWDSLLTLIFDDLDSTLEPPEGEAARHAYAKYERIATADDRELLAMVRLQVLKQTDTKAYEELAREQQTERAEQSEALREAYAEAAGRGDAREARRIRERAVFLGLSDPGAPQLQRLFRRASDLPSPAPASHLLRALGQSDRTVLDGAHRDATVPQVLALLNGYLERHLLQNPRAKLMAALGDAVGPDAQIELAYQAVLARDPSESERATWRNELATSADQGVRDLVWTLVNSHEFLFVL